ncbi:MAG: hydroxymethylbilane synthase [Burkholderiaceae bacterium]|nr:hydroxymethylbilane synthase [Burkholderiaceae bacterium]
MVDRQGAGELTQPGAAPDPATLRIATRESRLALWQARHVADLLRARYPACAVELLGMTTRGDQIQDRPLAQVGGKGLFTKELEVALLDGRAELAVHSLKDVPMELPEPFELACVLERADPRDAFVSNRFADLEALPAGGIVGTSSLRRAAQLRERFPKLRIEPLRGNLDTRLAKLDAGGYDAIVLAAAGLKRLGLAARIRKLLTPEESLPAPGQGVLGIEVRGDALAVKRALAFLEHAPTRLDAEAERAVSRRLGGNCRTPLAAYARAVPGGELRIDALLEVDGGRIRRASLQAPIATPEQARELGDRVAAMLGG